MMNSSNTTPILVDLKIQTLYYIFIAVGYIPSPITVVPSHGKGYVIVSTVTFKDPSYSSQSIFLLLQCSESHVNFNYSFDGQAYLPIGKVLLLYLLFLSFSYYISDRGGLISTQT